jgi:hypothetical protein
MIPIRSYSPHAAAALALLAAACEPLQGEDSSSEISGQITISTTATYTLVGVQSNKCVEVQGGSTAAGARLQIAACNGTTRQQFKAEAVASGTYRLRNVNSGLCLDVSGASTVDGAAVIQWACGTATNQRWSFTDVASGIERLTAAHSGKVLDVTGNNTSDGALLEQWSWNGGTNQQFKMQQGGGGGSGGRTGSGGSSGAGGAAGGCGVQPVNSRAIPQARALLCYLYSQYGNHVLSGQQETSWSNPAGDISWYVTNTGKYPAILGGDYLYPSGTSDRAIAYWKAGGITMIRYHMGAPPMADTYQNSMSSANIANVLTSGTSENTSFRQKLDYVAAEIKKLQDNNVPLLWAPFHEAQPGGWFWWSKGTGAQYVQLWRLMYDYLTNTKGLNNILWLMPFSGSPNASFYPGKAYVDIAGPDTYGTNQPFTSMYSAARNIIGTTVPIALHETGVIPDPNAMFPTAAPWLLFNIWAGYQVSNNSVGAVQSVYANARTITRDEVPNLK